MDTADIIHHVNKALYLALMLSMPAILVASLVGLVFAVIQALTQLQEQTLSFAVKLIATGTTLALTLRWIGGEVFIYTQSLFDLVSIVGK